MADIIYDSFLVDHGNGSIDLDTDTIYGMLVTDSYTADRAHNRRDDITNEVAAGGGYTAGGAELTGKTFEVIAGNIGKFDGEDIVWTNSTITARGIVLYKSRGGLASADELIGYWDFGSNKSSSAGPFTAQWHTNGILRFAQA